MSRPALVSLGDAQRTDEADEPGAHDRSHDGDGDGDGYGHELCDKETPVAERKAVPTNGGVDPLRGEDAREDAAPDSSDAMATEGIKRIIVAKPLLDDRDGKEAHDARGEPDDERRPQGHISAARRDGYETDHNARGRTDDAWACHR